MQQPETTQMRLSTKAFEKERSTLTLKMSNM